MNDPQKNPYLVDTFAPRPTAPFNGIGVLADTQASITHAQNAIETFGYNLDVARDRAQQRVVKDVNFPYAVRQTGIMGQAGVRGAQAEQMRAGSAALNQGLAIDQFDPLAGDLGITRDGSRILYGGIDAPTTANPTMTQEQKVAFNQRALDTPYQVGGDINAQGQLAPLYDPNTPVPKDEPGWTDVPDPYNTKPLQIPGTPSSVVGITRVPAVRPIARPGFAQSAVDLAASRLQVKNEQLRTMDSELASLKKSLIADPNSISIRMRINSLETDRDILNKAIQSDTKNFNDAVRTELPANPPLVGGADNNYGIPTARQPGSDPLPETPANATRFEVPLAMARQRPDLVPGFQNAVSLYTTHAPGGPGGVEAALVTAALESDFAPAAKAKTSTATGMTQFTGDTWMRVAKTLPWAKGKSDDEVMALRSSPAHQAQAERQLRILNYAAATAKFPGQFDPANPLNLYAMHHFGEDTGGKIAAALRRSPNALLPTIIGAKAWAAAVAANPYLVQRGIPMTPAQLYANWIGRAQKRGLYGGVRA